MTMPPPSAKHGMYCARFVGLLESFVRARRLEVVTCNDAGVRFENDPDPYCADIESWWIRSRRVEMSMRRPLQDSESNRFVLNRVPLVFPQAPFGI